MRGVLAEDHLQMVTVACLNWSVEQPPLLLTGGVSIFLCPRSHFLSMSPTRKQDLPQLKEPLFATCGAPRNKKIIIKNFQIKNLPEVLHSVSSSYCSKMYPMTFKQLYKMLYINLL